MKAKGALFVTVLGALWACVLLLGFFYGLKKSTRPPPRPRLNAGKILQQQRRQAADVKRQQEDAMRYQRQKIKDLKQKMKDVRSKY